MTTSLDERRNELYEFGPFRVDPAREILLKAGAPVALTPKTFQILLVLVRNGQQVVTKDDLMKTVWPDTFVEEANLSRNVFMLRKALGETAQDHRYIVTVPGRGYRLAESVQVLPGEDFAVAAATHSKVEIEVTESTPWKWIAAAVVFLIVAGTLAWRFAFHRPPVLGAKDTVILADFANATGDAMLDDTLRQGLAIQLRQSPFLALISDQRIAHTLSLMGLRRDARLTPEVARGVCQRTGSAAVLEGSITPVGKEYALALKARSCRTGDLLAQEQVQAANKEDVLRALDLISVGFRKQLGESLTTIQEHNMPLADATTPSLEALESYSTGWRLHTASGAITALPLFQRAVAIDPDFALAHAALGRAYASLEGSDLSTASTTRAWQLRDRTSDREKFFIMANYEGLATGNLEAARQVDEAWANAYPREPTPHALLSGYPNKAIAHFEQAIIQARKAIDLDPDFAIAYYNLGVDHLYLGRPNEAEYALELAARRGLHTDEYIMLRHDIAFFRKDQTGMARALLEGRERSGGDTWISNKEAFAQAYTGHLREAGILTQRAVDQALQEAQPERAGLWEAGAALREAFFGNRLEATRHAAAALKHTRNREVAFGAALALATSGDLVQAKDLAAGIEHRYPEDSVVRFSYLPVIRARIALQQGDAQAAIDLLQAARPYELGSSRLLFGALYPVYLRGEALLVLRQGNAAAAEFEKILNHRGVVGSDPIGALAQLQYARALALAGESEMAKAAYKDFLELWNQGDPGIPVLRQAKVESAGLR